MGVQAPTLHLHSWACLFQLRDPSPPNPHLLEALPRDEGGQDFPLRAARLHGELSLE